MGTTSARKIWLDASRTPEERDRVAVKPNTPQAEHPRNANGQFLPGFGSPNPAGRNRILPDFVKACRDLTPMALNVIASIAQDTKARNQDRLKASAFLVERAYGRASQTIDMNIGEKSLSNKELLQKAREVLGKVKKNIETQSADSEESKREAGDGESEPEEA